MKILTILGAIFLPVMVLTSFFGMNLYFIDHGLDELIRMWIGWLNIENYPLLIQWVTWLPGFKYIPSFFSVVALFMLSCWCIKKYIKNIATGDNSSGILNNMKLKYFFRTKGKKDKNNSRKGE